MEPTGQAAAGAKPGARELSELRRLKERLDHLALQQATIERHLNEERKLPPFSCGAKELLQKLGQERAYLVAQMNRLKEGLPEGALRGGELRGKQAGGPEVELIVTNVEWGEWGE